MVTLSDQGVRAITLKDVAGNGCELIMVVGKGELGFTVCTVENKQYDFYMPAGPAADAALKFLGVLLEEKDEKVRPLHA